MRAAETNASITRFLFSQACSPEVEIFDFRCLKRCHLFFSFTTTCFASISAAAELREYNSNWANTSGAFELDSIRKCTNFNLFKTVADTISSMDSNAYAYSAYPSQPHFQNQSLPSSTSRSQTPKKSTREVSVETDYEASENDSLKESDEFEESASDQSERGWSSEGETTKVKKGKGKGKNLVDLPENYDADLYGIRRSVSVVLRRGKSLETDASLLGSRRSNWW